MIADHQPPNVTASDDADFVVISAEDWECEQETR
jgi:PHD/YefM family antitoxin component YafN of YafNO toxin-antitoxin module